MNRAITSLVLIAAVPCVGAEDENRRIPKDKAGFHVFLLMGQSNMAGGIPGKELTEEDKTPVPRIVLRRGKGGIPAAHPLHLGGKKNGFGLGLPFAKQYLKNHPGVTVGLVPCASGGKRIDLLKKGSNLYRYAMGKSRLALEQGTIKGILWHQGESDTVTDERADSYEEKLHRLIADVGIIGFPNVGKSTLLSAASAAKPEVAGYPFTTREPVLGVVEAGTSSFVMAEIPGLISGAHLGRGLGHDFLRHIARTRMLVHLLDGSSASPLEDMQKVNAELGLFDSHNRAN